VANVDLKADQTIAIRGATLALSQAAVNIAAHAGARVIATTRNLRCVETLEQLGAREVMLEAPHLPQRVRELHAHSDKPACEERRTARSSCACKKKAPPFQAGLQLFPVTTRCRSLSASGRARANSSKNRPSCAPACRVVTSIYMCG